MNNLIDEVASHGLLKIKEQNLLLEIDNNYSIFDYKNDLYVIIAHEFKYHNGKNTGDLMVGIIRIVKNDITNKYEIKLILPFTKKLLRAKIKDNYKIDLYYLKNDYIYFKQIDLEKDFTIPKNEYQFLLEEDTTICHQKGLERTRIRKRLITKY